MKAEVMLVRSALALALLSTLNAQLSTAFAQGALTPSGPPAPTMKSLAQIEPRIPISVVPLAITNSGSYYLTTNLINTSNIISPLINIGVSDVVIDLNGFSLLGPATYTGLQTGITAGAGTSNIVVRNGTLSGFTRWGIDLHDTVGAVVENVLARDNGYAGIEVGNFGVVTHCVADGNVRVATGGGGIVVGHGSVVSYCTATAQSFKAGTCGIVVDNSCSVDHCIAIGNNATNGFGILAGNGCTLSDCVASSNGVSAAVDGIFAGWYATIRHCVACYNSGDGIVVVRAGLISENQCSGNGGDGIRTASDGCRIDGNHMADNAGRGIRLNSVNSSIVIRNTATGNGGGDFPAAGSNIGPVQTPSTSTSPWANFSF